MPAIWIIGGTALVLAALGALEWRRHLANLARVPVRVHVNGTRGKSSVVRLIAAGLRHGGVSTLAKTTGSLAITIFPDGSEAPVERAYTPNIMEQTRFVSLAAELGVQALVMECMALTPDLQAYSELRFVRSTVGVITNVGPDHLDVMGPGEEDVALSLAGTVPVGGLLFTTESRRFGVLATAGADRRAEVVHVGPDRLRLVAPEEMDRFDYVEHVENVALALAVCEHLGVERRTALEGMQHSRCDPGAMTVHDRTIDGHRVVFVNAFGANDPNSTRLAWHTALDRHPEADRTVLLVNCRADRPHRSRQLGQACPAWSPADRYLVMGERTGLFVKPAVDRGLPRNRIRVIGTARPAEVGREIAAAAGRTTLVVGAGNIGHGGLELVRFFQDGAPGGQRP